MLMILMISTIFSVISFFTTKFGFKSNIIKYETQFDFYRSLDLTDQEIVDQIKDDERQEAMVGAISQSQRQQQPPQIFSLKFN